MSQVRKLYRNTDEQRLGGVCAGVADYLNIDVTIVRIIFLFSALMGGLGGILYIIMWLVVPIKGEKGDISPQDKSGN